MFVIKGLGVLVIRGKRFVLSSGQVLFIPECMHVAEADEVNPAAGSGYELSKAPELGCR